MSIKPLQLTAAMTVKLTPPAGFPFESQSASCRRASIKLDGATAGGAPPGGIE